MKRILFTLMLAAYYILTFSQTSVAECAYTYYGNRYSALIVLNGDFGKCHVLSSVGDCWFDARYSYKGAYSTITIYSPSNSTWIGGTFYFNSDGTNYAVFQNNKYLIAGNVIPQERWAEKMSQYGFNSISFKGSRGSCNIQSHRCSGFVDRNHDHICDVCPASEKCHATRHSPN